MSITTDFHSHVVRSSARQMVRAAQKRGLRVLGLSEHVFQMTEGRAPLEHMVLEGPMLSFSSYIEAVQAASQDCAVEVPGNVPRSNAAGRDQSGPYDAQGRGVEVRLGLEVDFIPEKNTVIQASLQAYPWDFLIGSVHEIDGIVFERIDEIGQEEGEALWLRYMELLRAAVNSGYFSLVSHPVRMGSRNPHLPPTLDDELERLAAEATRNDIALEANGYDVLLYPQLVRRLVRACALHRTPISVGSDAHNPLQIAQAHQQTEAVLRKAGIKTVRIWKQRQIEEYAI
ncbi:MAG TPA: PHP domain-containing protein [Ktedonosporobacter sp.]|jgi:histidinol-phosphatase (PHP family)|nr:PHP domain-containing protein [Ktedonosporobacter sp.]